MNREPDGERSRSTMRWCARIAAGIAAVVVMLIAGLSIVTPFPLHRLQAWPASPVVRDSADQPILQRVGADDQWRLPIALDAMSPWVQAATIAVEDERFRSHGGVDGPAVVRAAWQNVTAGRVVSGASTITMQVCRMMDDRPRTLTAKMIESFRALQLEHVATKDEILEHYLNLAPYGGNLRGIEAASRRYFGRSASDLSLAEAALLAGLPQSPERLRPDRNLDAARRRQATVLHRMHVCGQITTAQRDRALTEPLHIVSSPLSTDVVPHGAWMAMRRSDSLGGITTLDSSLQRVVSSLVDDHVKTLPPDTDVAVVLIDIERSAVVALVGSADPADPLNGQVNGATARRSAGSTLKPLIFAAAFDARRLAPDSVVHDVPIERAGWTPRNFDRTHRGAISAREALRDSLNVPAILVMEAIGVRRCAAVIERCGVSLPVDAVTRAGLGLAVGAVEVSLLELTNAYATIGRGGVHRTARLLVAEEAPPRRVLSPPVCAALDGILSSHDRVPSGLDHGPLEHRPWFMWKTGTSSGRRDAWAVGHNGRFAAGVWVGRFDGSGHARYVGREAAEPLLAAVFTQPRLHGHDPDDTPPEWIVTRPIRPPHERVRLRVVSPHEGAAFIALDDTAFIPLEATSDDVRWFLNGTLLHADTVARLHVGPGQHEVRCVDARGNAAASRFEVRSSAGAAARGVRRVAVSPDP